MKKQENIPFLLEQQGCTLLATLFRDADETEQETLLREIRNFASYLQKQSNQNPAASLRSERRCKRFEFNTLCTILVGDKLAKMVIDDISTSGIKGRVMEDFFKLIHTGNNYTISLKSLRSKRENSKKPLPTIQLSSRLVRFTHINNKETAVSFEYNPLSQEQYDGLTAFIRSYIKDEDDKE